MSTPPPLATKSDRYLLDANIFIEASQRYYAFDIVPNFWITIRKECGNNKIVSIDRIKTEIDKGKDELSQWAEDELSHGFLSTADMDVIDEYRKVMEWAARQPQFTAQAQAEFATVADGWLVAYAMAKGGTVVTHEVLDHNIKKRIKIPNVCLAMNVQYCNTYQMLRSFGARY